MEGSNPGPTGERPVFYPITLTISLLSYLLLFSILLSFLMYWKAIIWLTTQIMSHNLYFDVHNNTSDYKGYIRINSRTGKAPAPRKKWHNNNVFVLTPTITIAY